MHDFQTEGVVLQALPFKDYDSILTVFTPLGLQKFFVKGKKSYNPLTAPLTVAEFLCTKGKNDLHRLIDGSLISQNLKLRESLESLVAAEKLALAILQSQMPGKPAAELYQLFCTFLAALPSLQNPERLASAFYLKTMKHEGVLQLAGGAASFRFAGECFTKEEAPFQAEDFSPEDEALLQKIALSRKLDEIAFYPQTKFFMEKIFTLFHQAFPSLTKL